MQKYCIEALTFRLLLPAAVLEYDFQANSCKWTEKLNFNGSAEN